MTADTLMHASFADGSVVLDAQSAILYGAGRVGRDVRLVLAKQGIPVRCFLDRRALAGEERDGVPVYCPDSCPLSPEERRRIPVVLSMFNRDVDILDVAHRLRTLGFERLVSFVNLHAEWPDEFNDRYWLTRRASLGDHAEDIASADRLWADDQSRCVYQSLLALRRRGEYSEASRPRPSEVQYFPNDVPSWLDGRPLRFVDGGAFDGDSLRTILRLGIPLEAVAHFEPDPANFSKIAHFVAGQQSALGVPICMWPCALGDRSRLVSFNPASDEASAVAPDGQIQVQAVALSDVLLGWMPTLIKLDIEGAELDALAGAKQLIAQSRPALAICAYHRPDHLWRIPLVLNSWVELAGYDYYLRVHGYDGFDAVVYARPRTAAESPSRSAL